MLLLAARDSQIFFELLLHGGDARELVKWWQKYLCEAVQVPRIYSRLPKPKYSEYAGVWLVPRFVWALSMKSPLY